MLCSLVLHPVVLKHATVLIGKKIILPCVRVCACVYVRACVRACGHACVRACVRACAHVYVSMRACVSICDVCVSVDAN